MKRNFSFKCPGNGVEIEGTYNSSTQSTSLHVTNEALEGRDNETCNEVIEFVKTKCVRNVTWAEAQKFLNEQGVEKIDL